MNCQLNWLAFGLFLLLNMAACWLCKQPGAMVRRVVRRICWLLLGGNLLRYLVIYPAFYHIIKIPAEFSTVAYFVVPIILLLPWRRLDVWAAYSGLMAGFFYYLAMILAGQALYGAETAVNVGISLACHGALYFCGFAVTATELCPRRTAAGLALGVGYVAARAALLRPLVLGRSQMLIYILMDAIPARLLFPEDCWPSVLPVYYVLIAAFLFGSISVFFRYNESQYRKFTAALA